MGLFSCFCALLSQVRDGKIIGAESVFFDEKRSADIQVSLRFSFIL